MKCRKCGSELDSDSVFCPECGTRVERPVENNSGDIVRDNVNSGTTADIPKQTKRGNTLLKIVIAILIVIILKSVVFKENKQTAGEDKDFQSKMAETVKETKNTESLTENIAKETAKNIVKETERKAESEIEIEIEIETEIETESEYDAEFYKDALDSINDSVWLQGTVAEDGETLMLEKSVNICAEDEKNEKKRKDNIKSVKIFSDEPEIGEAKADPETMKGAKVRINGTVFFMGDSVVMYANDAVVLEEAVSEEQKVHTYILVQKDCTWDEAFEECKRMGGYLARINTEEEWNQIKKQIKEEGKEKIQFFLGARRNSGEKEYYWVDEDNEFTGDRLDNNDEQWCKDVWLKGEPSYYDSSVKKDEDRLNIFYYSQEDKWVFNDVPNNILDAVPQFKERIGYICEIEE